MAHMDAISSLDRSVRRHFKKVFNRLNDEYIIREPVLVDDKVAPIVIEGPGIEGPGNSWLMLGQHECRPAAQVLTKFNEFNQNLKSLNFQPVQYLAIVATPPSLFDAAEELPDGVVIIEQDDFYATGEQQISKYLTEVSVAQYGWVKKTLFPESVIPPQCTTRRKALEHNNSARLQQFFLDYDQELATRFDMLEYPDESEELQEDFSVRLVIGVAGSGKTLILINRALLFCKKYPAKRALLIVHNKPVTADIKYRIEHWLGGKPDNLTIQTFHQFALRQKARLSNPVRALFKAEKLLPYQLAILNDSHECYRNLSLSDAQIWSEIEYINENLIQDAAEYFAYERHGQGFALQKSQRVDIWQLYELTVSMLSSHKSYLPSLYIREVALTENTERLQKYDHVLVDEAQFFAPSWLQLVRQSLCERGSIFLCADPNQGFLKSRLSWKSVGFNVQGRTKKLSYSYRTTYEIMLAANILIESMDESSDDFVKPDLERMQRGLRPQVVYSLTTQDEQRRFVNELKLCITENRVPLSHIMVLCDASYSQWTLKSLLERQLGNSTVINCNDPNEPQSDLGGRIRLMSINSCAGMEAGITLVLGVGRLMTEAKNLDLRDDERELAYKESIRRLYVAMTRAGQKLVLFSTEKLPDSMNDLVDFSGAELEELIECD